MILTHSGRGYGQLYFLYILIQYFSCTCVNILGVEKATGHYLKQ